MKLKSLLKKFKTSEFWVAISTSGISAVVKMLAGLLINKIISIKIGPRGIAMIGQFLNFSALATNLANASYGQGVTKYIADPDVDERKVLATSNIFTTAISIVIGLVIAMLARQLSYFLFKTEEYTYIFYIFAAALPFFALNSLLLSSINGFREFKLLAVLKITNSIVALIIAGLLCWYFLLDGALIALSINTSVVFVLSVYIIVKAKKFSKLFNFNLSDFDKKTLVKLLGFALMTLTSAQLKPLVLLYLRNYIIVNDCETAAGIWEGTKRLSDYYFTVISTALASYYLPKLSSLKTNYELKKELFSGVKIIMPLFVLMAIIIYLFRNFIIVLLFSKEFMQISDLMLPQLIGDFFMILSLMIAYLMLAKAMLTTFMITQLAFAGLRILLSTYLFNIMGIEGMIWANAINYFLYCICLILIFKNIIFSQNEDFTHRRI